MKILIDIGHPAHVHLFKHFVWDMQKKKHEILFTCRDKEFEIYLLKTYGFEFTSFGQKYSSRLGKVWGLIEFDIKEFLSGLKFKPDILISHGSIYAAHAAFLLGKPHISLEDTFNFEQIRLYLPFTKAVLTGDYEHPSLGKKELRYAGYHELAYLHPHRFQPNNNILELLGIRENDKYVIIRFVAWTATHDYGHKGISLENKLKAIQEFEKYATVFISSEAELPNELKSYQIEIPPHMMHDAMYYASLLFSESATMASECNVLGVPSIYIDNSGRYYMAEQELHYGLCFNFTESESDQRRAIDKGIELLKSDNRDRWLRKHDKMLEDKIDVTAFLVWFIEHWPESFEVMKKNPEYQNRFKYKEGDRRRETGIRKVKSIK